MTPSSKTPVRNLKRPPSMTWRTEGSWHTSNQAKELKFGTQVNNHILWWSITSRMTPSTKTPVRDHQSPPSMTSRMGSSWFTPNHARELKFCTQVNNHISWWSMMLRMTPSSKTPVRNLKRPPSMTWRTEGSWHTSNQAKELKFGTQVNNHILWWSIMSRMTPSTKTPVRDNQSPPSMTSRMGGSWFTPNHARELKFGTQVNYHISWWSVMSRMTPSSKTPVRNHQCPPSMTSRMGGSWLTSNHARELWMWPFPGQWLLAAAPPALLLLLCCSSCSDDIFSCNPDQGGVTLPREL